MAFRLLIAALVLTLATALGAQQQDAPADAAVWDDTAKRAEQALGDEEIDSQSLEQLRAEIAEFRQRFATSRDAETARIDTLRAQIDALGEPQPDARESREIATRRSELEAQLAAARAPSIAAQEAYTRAEGLIREIDTEIRERQAARLTARAPMPLNPVNWPGTAEDFLRSVRLFFDQPEGGWITPEERAALLGNLPEVLGLFAAGLLLLVAGPDWAERGIAWLRRRTRRGTGVWRFLLSLGLIVLPLAGILGVVAAIETAGILSDRAEDLAYGVPVWLGIFLVVRWLARQTFSRDDDEATLPIDPARRAEARTYFGILALMVILREVLDTLAELDAYAAETVAVVEFPIVLLSSIVFFRVCQILVRAKLSWDDETETEPQDGLHFRLRVARALGRMGMLVAVAAPLFGAAGYLNLAQAILFPAIGTLVIGGVVLVLLRLTGDLYALVTGQSPQDTNTLVPVAAGFVLTLAALPVVALAWGARVADLTELWNIFTTGVTLGETRISPTVLGTFLLIFLGGFGLTRLLQGALRSAVLPRTKIDIGGRNAIVAGVGYLGVFLAALAAFAIAGINLSSLAIVAGALSVGIGFGLQNIVQNFVSGIILLIERPISEGDWVQVGENMGFVKDISVRSTRIETFDRFDVIVPNGDFISGTVTNYTRGNVIGRLIVPVSVAYGSDTRKVEAILLSIAREHPLVLMNPAPFIYFRGFENSALNFEIRVILIDILEVLEVQTEMNHQIAERFAAEGIEIPFPQRDLWLRNPETLTGGDVAAHRSFAGEGQGTRGMPDNVIRRRTASGPGDAD